MRDIDKTKEQLINELAEVRQQMGEALRESEEKLRIMFDSIGEGIIINDLAGNIVDLNEALLRMAGFSRKEELIGRNSFEFVAEKDRTRAIEDLKRALEEKRPREKLEYTLLNAEGEEFEVEFSPAFLRDSSGNLAGVIGVVSDITERKRAEEALWESEERLQDFFENANDLIQSVAPDGRLLYVNRAWRETLGYTEEEIAGLSLFDVIHPDSLAHFREIFQRVISGEKVYNIEAKFLSKDGRVIMVEGSANCRFKDGEPVATRGLFRDVTERKRMEETLERRKEELEQLTNELLALQKVTTSIQSALELKKVLLQVTEAVVVNLGYDHSFILTLDEARDVLRGTVFFTKGGSKLIREVERAVSRALTELEHPLVRGYTPALDAALDGKATVGHHLYEMAVPLLTRDECDAVQELLGAKTMVNMPLFARDQFVGNIVAFTEREEISEVELEPLRILADQAGVAVENAHLYQAEKRMRENLGFHLHQVTIAQEEERKRIARELHDDMTYELVALSRQLDKVITTGTKLSKRDSKLLEGSRQAISRILEGIRRFTQDLRPSILDDLGLLPALEWLASELTKQFGVANRIAVMGTERRFSPEVELAMFRIAQEALRNACQHARASNTLVTVEYGDDRTVLRISDNGKGFKLPENLRDMVTFGKLGLIGMEERAQLIGGTLSVQSEPGKGTTVTAVVPI